MEGNFHKSRKRIKQKTNRGKKRKQKTNRGKRRK